MFISAMVVCSEREGPGAVFIDCSTIDVETARAVIAEAEMKGFLMPDAPVSGGTGGAQQVARSPSWSAVRTAAFAKAKPVLEQMA
jgi:3-hydroxyisobutyrate dehydrogenase